MKTSNKLKRIIPFDRVRCAVPGRVLQTGVVHLTVSCLNKKKQKKQQEAVCVMSGDRYVPHGKEEDRGVGCDARQSWPAGEGSVDMDGSQGLTAHAFPAQEAQDCIVIGRCYHIEELATGEGEKRGRERGGSERGNGEREMDG